jgi:AcrR family transcriptional regulator
LHYSSESAKLHFVTDSAISRRSRLTRLRITEAAQRLADERGSIDGFTLEELAEAADVSRRTLFNHFPSKVDAVLGPELDIAADAVATFRSGGPNGDLIEDLQAMVLRILEVETQDVEIDVEMIHRFDRIVHANPALLVLLKERMGRLVAQLVEIAAQRPGGDLPTRDVQVAIAVLTAVTETAVTAFTDDPEQDLAALIVDGIATVRRLFG